MHEHRELDAPVPMNSKADKTARKLTSLHTLLFFPGLWYEVNIILCTVNRCKNTIHVPDTNVLHNVYQQMQTPPEEQFGSILTLIQLLHCAKTGCNIIPFIHHHHLPMYQHYLKQKLRYLSLHFYIFPFFSFTLSVAKERALVHLMLAFYFLHRSTS